MRTYNLSREHETKHHPAVQTAPRPSQDIPGRCSEKACVYPPVRTVPVQGEMRELCRRHYDLLVGEPAKSTFRRIPDRSGPKAGLA